MTYTINKNKLIFDSNTINRALYKALDATYKELVLGKVYLKDLSKNKNFNMSITHLQQIIT